MTCPSQDVWRSFLEHELDDEENERLLAHLRSCGSCPEVVKAMITEEKSLMEALLEIPGTKGLLTSHEACPPLEALWAYAEDRLADRSSSLEAHLDTCDRCLWRLMRIQQILLLPELDLDPVAVLNQLSLEKKASPITEEAESPLKGLLEIVLKFSRAAIEIVYHNGELLVSGPAPVVRGKGRGAKKGKERVSIQKKFEATEVSVEVTVTRVQAKRSGELKISVMSLTSEEFLQGLKVRILHEGHMQEQITNKDGEASFSGVEPGEYAIEIQREGEQRLGRVALIVQ